MPRPGPLQELPLDLFLPPNPNIPVKSRPNKRPLSPGGPNLFSPAKRRILNDEGIFSPEKTIKSPISGRATPARFAQILTGPASPARKLDFGPAKHHIERPTLVIIAQTRTLPSGSKLPPSSEFGHSFSRHQDDDQEISDYFSYSPHPSSSRSTSTPRDMPPPPDPQSVHFPGFRVHYDPHMLPTLADQQEDFAIVEDVNEEQLKENVAPRKKPRKAVTAPNTGFKHQLLSPEAKRQELEKVGKARSTPATPKKVLSGDRLGFPGSPTPRRPMEATGTAAGSTPRLTNKGKHEMRRVLQDEADQLGNEDDDIDML